MTNEDWYTDPSIRTSMAVTWNHRVLRHVHDEEEYFQIHEAYYDGGTPHSCTKEPVAPFGETLDELRAELACFAAALDKPILNYDDF